MLLLQHFKKSLLDDENVGAVIVEDGGDGDGDGKLCVQHHPPKAFLGTGLEYVQKWSKSKTSMIFSLSNRSVQVIFVDNVELVISSERIVAYTDKVGYDIQISSDSQSQSSTPISIVLLLSLSEWRDSNISLGPSPRDRA